MKRLLALLPLVTLLCAGAAQADVAYNNMAATPDSASPDTLDVQGPMLGNSFSVSGVFQFNTLELLLQAAPISDLVNLPIQDGLSFDVELYSGGSDLSFGPTHQTLKTLQDNDFTTTAPAEVDLDLTSLNITLAAGRYWIVLSTDANDPSTAGWAFSGDLTGPGVAGENYAAVGNFSANDQGLGPHQMAVLGTFARTGGSSVPEPLTLSLFGMGLAGAAVLRRRKKSA